MFQYFPSSKWHLRSVVLFPYSYPSFRTGVSTVKVSNATTVYKIEQWVGRSSSSTGYGARGDRDSYRHCRKKPPPK